MTSRKTATLSVTERPSDDDARDRNGRRSRNSRWTRVELRDVEVTQDDIDNAMKADSHSCMIADAIKRQHPEFRNVGVDITTIRWTDTSKARRVMCLTPLVCQQKLAAFDYGGAVMPFKFSMKSTQVTPAVKTEPKLDEHGKPVLKRVGGQLKKVSRIVSQPTARKVFENTTSDGTPHGDHVIGGRLPPMNRASRYRKFGVRGFTWADGEDPEAIAARQQVAYGWTDEQMAAEGWQFAKDRLAAKAAAEGGGDGRQED